jgi:hypothetical protein
VSDIKISTGDMFELVNPILAQEGDEAPTLLLEAGVWKTNDGSNKSGISVSTFGELAPLIEPQDARRLAKWLLSAADELSGEKRLKNRKGPKRTHYEDDDDNY